VVTSYDYNQCSESASDVINTPSEITTIHLFVIVDTGCKRRHTAVSNSTRAARGAAQRNAAQRSEDRLDAAQRAERRQGEERIAQVIELLPYLNILKKWSVFDVC